MTELNALEGKFGPDGYDRKKNEVLLVYNIRIFCDARDARSKLFIVGRSLFGQRSLPDGIIHAIMIDLRGQSLPEEEVVKYETSLRKMLEERGIRYFKINILR